MKITLKNGLILAFALFAVFAVMAAAGYNSARKDTRKNFLEIIEAQPLQFVTLPPRPVSAKAAADILAAGLMNVREVSPPETLPSITFRSASGQVLANDDLTGRYVLLNLWATWCAPCITELPSLEQLSRRFDTLDVVAVSLDMGKSIEEISGFLERRGIGAFAAYLDHTRSINKSIRMRGLPTSLLLDPQGRILYIFEGDADWASEEATAFFEAVLSAN